jgi:hypothetical protein
MVVSPMEALSDVGYTWQTWGGVWGGERDPVHFQYPGFVPPLVQTSGEGLSWWEQLLLGSKGVDVIGGAGGTEHVRQLADQYYTDLGL